jgi:hypothetical protein
MRGSLRQRAYRERIKDLLRTLGQHHERRLPPHFDPDPHPVSRYEPATIAEYVDALHGWEEAPVRNDQLERVRERDVLEPGVSSVVQRCYDLTVAGGEAGGHRSWCGGCWTGGRGGSARRGVFEEGKRTRRRKRDDDEKVAAGYK